MTDHPPADLYLDLMAKVITRYGFEGHHVTVMPNLHSYEYYLWKLIQQARPDRDMRLVETVRSGPTFVRKVRTGPRTRRAWSG